ncbi:MAG: OB-fold nucleic acid binding domain-containing protein [Methanobacterium sp.]
MHDNQIFKIALITTVLGLAGMMLLSNQIMPQEFKIKDINKNNVGEDIIIEGLITTVESPQNGLYTLYVVDETGKMTVVIFSNLSNEFNRQGINISSFQNHRAKITGRVNEYKGSIQLIIEDTKSIKIIN